MMRRAALLLICLGFAACGGTASPVNCENAGAQVLADCGCPIAFPLLIVAQDCEAAETRCATLCR